MSFLVKKAISPSNLSRPTPTIAPLPAPSTPASHSLYPRFRTLYPRFRTLYPRTPVPPVHPLIGADFILMDDNARLHRAHVTNQYLEDETIVRMDWPARSHRACLEHASESDFCSPRYPSSEQHYRRDGPDSLSNSSVGLSVACGGGVKL